MKQAIAFLAVLLLCLAALFFSERHEHSEAVTANAVLNAAADIQRDLTRVPLRFTRLSDSEEIRIGNELADGYVREQRLSPKQQALEAYVQRVGMTLAPHAHRKLPYRFHLIPEPSMINAFSLPGGHVFVGEGLLDLMMSEDQLANVLGHEVEHVDHYHCAERVQVEAQLRHLQLGAVGALVQLPLELFEAGYNKDEEFEADREGMRLAVQAGYSPYGAVAMFEKFAKLQREYVIHAESPEEELSQLAIASLTGYFRSHPLPSERLAQARTLIVQEHWEDLKLQKPFHVEDGSGSSGFCPLSDMRRSLAG
jgi:beta-barrel assembly-enhancing protease